MTTYVLQLCNGAHSSSGLGVELSTQLIPRSSFHHLRRPVRCFTFDHVPVLDAQVRQQCLLGERHVAASYALNFHFHYYFIYQTICLRK